MRLSTITTRWTAVGATAGVVVIAGVVAVTLVNSGAAQAPEYQVSDCRPSTLKVDGASWGGGATAVSPSGEYILGDGDAMLWGPDGETASIPGAVKKGIGGLRAVQPLDVNSQGTVVGQAYTKGDNDLIGWKYADGEVTELQAPAKYRDEGVTVHAINDDGDIVGKSAAGSTEGAFLFTWADDATEAQAWEADKKGAIGGTVDIADDGSVIAVGRFGESGEDKLWKWSAAGEREKVPYPKGVADTIEFQLAGDWLLIDGLRSESYRWNMTDTKKPREPDLDVASGIDSQGRVFGRDSDDVPAVDTGSGVEKLPLPDGADAKEFASTTVGIHSGVVAGTGETKEGPSAMVWRCADS